MGDTVEALKNKYAAWARKNKGKLLSRDECKLWFFYCIKHGYYDPGQFSVDLISLRDAGMIHDVEAT